MKKQELQQRIIQTLNTKPTINPAEETANRVRFIKQQILESKTNGAVIGLSGGQDSTLAGLLTQKAIEELNTTHPDRNYILYLVALPYGEQSDYEDVLCARDLIRPHAFNTMDIKPVVDSHETLYNETHTTEPLQDFNKGNIKARTRAVIQYAIANQHNLLVIGTDHAAESIMGYFTKYGDGAADIIPLYGLNKRQGKQLLIHLAGDGASPFITKIPTGDLLDNKPQQADEVEMGVEYSYIDDFLEGKPVPEEVWELITQQYLKTQHKRQTPQAPR